MLAACENGAAVEIINLLINAGSLLNKADEVFFSSDRSQIYKSESQCGRFPLLAACEKGTAVEIIKVLVKAGSNVNGMSRVLKSGLLFDLNTKYRLDAILCWLHVRRMTLKLFEFLSTLDRTSTMLTRYSSLATCFKSIKANLSAEDFPCLQRVKKAPQLKLSIY